MRLFRQLLLGLAMSLAACGPGRPGDTTPQRDRRTASRPEIEEAIAQNISNAFDFVSRHHSDWLRSRATPTNSAYYPNVYLDNVRLGQPQVLRSIPLQSVTRMRFLMPSEAEAEFGQDNLAGAIAVYTR